jgi:hypothetical protein
MRYSRFLSQNDFSKLAVLMRDLAPSLVLLMRPENVCRIRRGDPEASRANLRLVLDGERNARRYLVRGRFRHAKSSLHFCGLLIITAFHGRHFRSDESPLADRQVPVPVFA